VSDRQAPLGKIWLKKIYIDSGSQTPNSNERIRGDQVSRARGRIHHLRLLPSRGIGGILARAPLPVAISNRRT